ncbi:gliding motility lipoprotein GldB [Cecembia calidifontis]|jgi:gliding motility-associated lipoprotein GldB|uniref:Gliding motility-associated lipoprotein GldB n=1 Tax=Cecembia calidifontis TaxID=1187080 RepID=A0A4V2F660_9BACT|nr:gliding motility lipoprotein GldB [Cecembia calidifontis]RZS95189.1 gliding motility-associated lipoprotein GldB [Cecembia calidifontis]
MDYLWRISALFLMLIFSFSCQKKGQECVLDNEILAIEIDFELERLEDKFFQARTEDEFLLLLETYPEFAKNYLQVGQYPSKDELVEELMFVNQDSLMVELYEEVKKNFSDFSDLEEKLKTAFKHIKYYYPEFKVPKVYTFVTGFGSDIYLDRDILVIGLDYYLPFEHRFQPPDLPQYITKRYQKDYLVPMVVMAISSQFNKTDMSQNTLLAEMIYYGKAYHFTKSILPCTPDEFIIGYTQEEVAACFANEEMIWSHFVENDLLFTTNPFEIRKYIGEAPFTDAISPDAPGRLGRWLGWNIVDDYRFNNKFSLQEVMMESDTEKIFRQSGYKPRR